MTTTDASGARLSGAAGGMTHPIEEKI